MVMGWRTGRITPLPAPSTGTRESMSLIPLAATARVLLGPLKGRSQSPGRLVAR
jgi:hypothetical protein